MEQLPADLAGATGRRFLRHQEPRPHLRPGAVGLFVGEIVPGAAQLVQDHGHELAQVLLARSGMNAEDAGVREAPMKGVDRVAQPALLAHALEQAAGHAAAERRGENLRAVEVALVDGSPLEAEHELRVHEIADLAKLAAAILRALGLAAARGRGQSAETLFDLARERLVIDGARRHDDHAIGSIVPIEIAANVARAHRFHRLGRAEDRPADGLAVIGGLGEAVEHHIVGRVVRRTDLLQDHVLLALQLVPVDQRLHQDVA